MEGGRREARREGRTEKGKETKRIYKEKEKNPSIILRNLQNLYEENYNTLLEVTKIYLNIIKTYDILVEKDSTSYQCHFFSKSFQNLVQHQSKYHH